MNKNIPNIYVFIMLCIIMLIFGTLIVKKTIGSTNQLLANYDELNNQLADNINFDRELKDVQFQIDEIDKVISMSKDDIGTVQNKIIQKIKEKGKNGSISITKVPEPHVFTELEYDIVTNTIECNGTYTELLKIIDFFEREFSRAKLSSVQFMTRKNVKTKKRKLYAKLYFQNIQK